MPIEIPSDLTPELVPFAWLLGTWEGNGFMGYGDAEQRAFRQRVTFEQTGLPFLVYRARTTLLDEEGEPQREATYEQGFWELARPREDGDIGPGMLPPDPVPVITSAEDVEKLRNADGGFDISVTISQPGGISELYLGQIKGPRVELTTDAVIRAQVPRSTSPAPVSTASSTTTSCGRGTWPPRGTNWPRTRPPNSPNSNRSIPNSD